VPRDIGHGHIDSARREQLAGGSKQPVAVALRVAAQRPRLLRRGRHEAILIT
jgi:hypothetical protein